MLGALEHLKEDPAAGVVFPKRMGYPEEFATMVESVDSGRPFNGVYRVIGSHGGEHVVQVRAQPTFGSAGTAVGLRGIGQEVTERILNRVNRDQPGS